MNVWHAFVGVVVVVKDPELVGTIAKAVCEGLLVTLGGLHDRREDDVST
jgi:hypothetical protein